MNYLTENPDEKVKIGKPIIGLIGLASFASFALMGCSSAPEQKGHYVAPYGIHDPIMMNEKMGMELYLLDDTYTITCVSSIEYTPPDYVLPTACEKETYRVCGEDNVSMLNQTSVVDLMHRKSPSLVKHVMSFKCGERKDPSFWDWFVFW